MLIAKLKAELRRTGPDRCRAPDGGDLLPSMSQAVQECFLQAFPPAPGSRIALYKGLPREVGTDLIRERYLSAGALLYYPRVMEDGGLSFHPHCGDDGWVRGKYGTLEPRVTPGVEGVRNGFDLIVVPGVAFDPKGRRLGRGYGYYDRFLAGLEDDVFKVGLVFSSRLLPEVPVDSWDVPVDAVVTEEGVIRVLPENVINK